LDLNKKSSPFFSKRPLKKTIKPTKNDAIPAIQNGGFVFVFKKNKNLFLQKKKQKSDLTKTRRVVFLKNGFFLTLIIFQSFFVIYPGSHDLEQVTSLSI